MRIAILGGTGYLGKKVVRQLCQEENQILCITRNPEKYKNSREIKYCGLIRLKYELDNFEPELFLNMSCCYYRQEKTEHDVMEANFYNPAKVLMQCMLCGTKRVITIGTSLPDEFNIYCFSKKLFCDLGKWYVNKYGIVFVNVRLENYYGENEPEDRFLPSVINSLLLGKEISLTEGIQRRDYIYIEDVVEAIGVLIMRKEIEGFVDVPVGSGEAPTIREVVEYLRDMFSSSSQLLFGAIPMREGEPNTRADIQKMRQFGLHPGRGWKDGMELLVKHIYDKS